MDFLVRIPGFFLLLDENLVAECKIVLRIVFCFLLETDSDWTTYEVNVIVHGANL